jgi:dihydrofolate reductase
MNNVIVTEFVTLDGIVEDPDGSQGSPAGGWAFRHGPETVAGDKFKLGPTLDRGVLLLGRATWQLFARIWPSRADEFAAKMNRIPKLVASRSLDDVSGWSNSALIDGDLVTEVQRHARDRDIIVAGSVSLAHQLAARDLVDEYRLLVFPTVLGHGRRLFAESTEPSHLSFASAEPSGPTILLRYRAR